MVGLRMVVAGTMRWSRCLATIVLTLVAVMLASCGSASQSTRSVATVTAPCDLQAPGSSAAPMRDW